MNEESQREINLKQDFWKGLQQTNQLNVNPRIRSRKQKEIE